MAVLALYGLCRDPKGDNKLGEFLNVVEISYGIFEFLWFMIGLKWRIKAWGHLPINF